MRNSSLFVCVLLYNLLSLLCIYSISFETINIMLNDIYGGFEVNSSFLILPNNIRNAKKQILSICLAHDIEAYKCKKYEEDIVNNITSPKLNTKVNIIISITNQYQIPLIFSFVNAMTKNSDNFVDFVFIVNNENLKLFLNDFFHVLSLNKFQIHVFCSHSTLIPCIDELFQPLNVANSILFLIDHSFLSLTLAMNAMQLQLPVFDLRTTTMTNQLYLTETKYNKLIHHLSLHILVNQNQQKEVLISHQGTLDPNKISAIGYPSSLHFSQTILSNYYHHKLPTEIMDNIVRIITACKGHTVIIIELLIDSNNDRYINDLELGYLLTISIINQLRTNSNTLKYLLLTPPPSIILKSNSNIKKIVTWLNSRKDVIILSLDSPSSIIAVEVQLSHSTLILSYTGTYCVEAMQAYGIPCVLVGYFPSASHIISPLITSSSTEKALFYTVPPTGSSILKIVTRLLLDTVKQADSKHPANPSASASNINNKRKVVNEDYNPAAMAAAPDLFMVELCKVLSTHSLEIFHYRLCIPSSLSSPLPPQIAREDTPLPSPTPSPTPTPPSPTTPQKTCRKGSITVILTQYRRNTTETQLRALAAQSLVRSIDCIIIYQEKAFINLDFISNITFKTKHQLPPVRIIHSHTRNFKYHGRFALALLVASEYTVIFDDDTIPQSGWLELAANSSRLHHAIVGPTGMILARHQQYIIAPPTDYTMEVDYVGHCWFFRTEWVRFLWREDVPSWECCEDMALSTAAWIHGRVRTVVPAMPLTSYSIWGDSYGSHHNDGNHTYLNPIPKAIRWPLTRYWLARGWVPAALRQGGSEACLASFPAGCRAAYDYVFNEHLNQSAAIPLAFYIYTQYIVQNSLVLLMSDNRVDICTFFQFWVTEASYRTTIKALWESYQCSNKSNHLGETDTSKYNINHHERKNISNICKGLKPWQLYEELHVRDVWLGLSCPVLLGLGISTIFN